MNLEDIARVAQAVNMAYCQSLGDNSQVPWDEAPQWQQDSVRAGVRLHVEHPDAGPERSHESWMDQKRLEGWTWGPIKDPEKKEHPCFLPFNQLPLEQQAKDFIFRAVVLSLAGFIDDE